MAQESVHYSAESGEDIAAALAEPWYRSRFAHRLERRFERETSRARSSQIRFALLLIAGLQFVVLLPDAQVGREQLVRGLTVRIGFLTPLLVLAAGLILRKLPMWLENITVVLSVLAAIACDCWMGLHGTGQIADGYFSGIGMGIFVNNIILPLRPRHAIVSTLASLAVYDAMIVGTFGPSPIVHCRQAALDMSLFVLVSLVFRWRSENRYRHTFLLTAQDRLHSQQLAWANRQLTQLSYTDALTGLPNRRYFDEMLPKAWKTALERGEPLALLMIDVDHFKNFNDSLGHAAGDKCLQRIAHAFQFSVRVDVDSVARLGGEEFVALLPGASLDDALHIGERVRFAIEALDLPHPSNPQGGFVTASVGAATCDRAEEVDSTELLQAADRALYSAKSRGRNCVVGSRLLTGPGDALAAPHFAIVPLPR